MQCSVVGCHSDGFSKGLCRKHYSRQYRTGSIEIKWTRAEWIKGWANWSSKKDCLIWPFGRHVNPHHLEWASPSQNQQQRAAHGTSNAGERNWSAKLTQQQVDAIRNLYASGGVRQKDIAAQFGVSRSLVGQIVTGKIWLARVYGFVSEREQAA